MSDPLLDKADIRKAMRRRRAAFDREARRTADARIFEALTRAEVWRGARNVLAYASMQDEVATVRILEQALSEGKRLALPRCAAPRKTFDAVAVDDPADQLVSGAFRDLREPAPELPALPAGEPFDLILIPGLAFDRRGTRLGFGAGMYDRFLARHGAGRRVALAYAFQIVETLPRAAHDLPMHFILTENEWISCESVPPSSS